MSRYQRYAVEHGGMIQYIRASSWFNVKREMARIYGADFMGVEIEQYKDGALRTVYKFYDDRWVYKVTEFREEES